MLVEIDDQILGLVRALVEKRVGVQLVAVTQGRADARHELGGADGLGEIVVGAQIESVHLLLLLGAGRDNDDGDAGPGADLLDDLRAVHIRQSEIQKDEVRALGRGHGQRDGAVVYYRGFRCV